jgi:hypothetical protein
VSDFAAWYRRQDYNRIREIMDDGNRFPATFNEWEKTAKSQVARAAAHVITIKPVILDPEEFVAFCDGQKIPRGSKERGMFAVARATAKDLN